MTWRPWRTGVRSSGSGGLAAAAVFWTLFLGSAFVVIYPMIIVLVRTFLPDGVPSLGVFDVAGRLPIGQLVLNTMILAGASTLLALVIAGVFAWLNERTDARLGILGEVVPITSLLVPHIAAVAGWVVLFEPRIGYVNVLIRNLTGSVERTGPFDIYSFPGMIAVTTLFLIPYGYLLLSAALRNLDPSLEEASRLSGAGLLRTLRRVTLPSVLPAIVDAGILMLITGMTIFSVPIVIGSRAEIDVLSTAIYRYILRYPPQTDAAVLLSLGMLVIIQVLLFARHRVLSRRPRTMISGKGFRSSVVRLGRFRWLGKGAGLAYVVLGGILPLFALALVAIQPFWSANIDWSKVSLAHVFRVIEIPASSAALVNSLLLAAGAGAILIILIGALITLARYARRGGSRLVDSLANLPATIPHIVIAVAFLFAFAGAPFMLHGTIAILIMAYVVEYMPQAVRSVQAAHADVGQDLPDAARVFGAGAFRVVRRVVIPLAMPGLIGGWIIVFSHVYSEVTVSSLLSGVGNLTVGRLLIDFLEGGSFPQLAAVSLIMTIVTALPVFVMMWISRRSFARRL
jgi:iron(III) transport system permease protein